MFVAKVPNRSFPPCYLLRESHRVNGKVTTTTLANLSHLELFQIEAIAAALKGQALVPLEGALTIDRSLPHGHVAAIVGTLGKLGIDRLIEAEDSKHLSLVLGMMALRMMAPSSKLSMTRMLRAQTETSSLRSVLALEHLNENDLYGAMDWLLPRQDRIEKKLAQRHLADGMLVLYDITSVYFEGTKCELARYGHNREGKEGTTQIVVGLVCSAEGCPVSVEVYEGNRSDSTRVAEQIERVKTKFGITKVVLVGDGGMITGKLIEKQAETDRAFCYVTALRSEAIRRLIKQGVVDRELFDRQEMAEVSSPDYPGQRLVVCMNPYLREERGRKREQLLDWAEKKLGKLKAAVERERRPLRGGQSIAMKVGAIFEHSPVKKHFDLSITESCLEWTRKKSSIEEERALDGLYIIRTNVDAAALPTDDAVRTYKRLSTVERAFRSMKLSDLEIRPVYHWNSDRVRAQVFLCMLAYYVEWHMRRALAPILFDEHDGDGKRAANPNPVATAQGSAAKKRKVASRVTDDGFPVHSFQTLLADLATLTLNTVKTPKAEAFTMMSVPTPLQAKAFELLGLGRTEISVSRSP